MIHLDPYLNFNGNCEQAFEHYKSIFGGEFSGLQRFGEMPPTEGYEVSEDEKNMILHMSLPIGDTILMGSDSPKSMGAVTFGNSTSISIQIDSKDEADRIFAGLSDGGSVIMPLGDTFWNAYYGMCTDKFGITWMINCDYSSPQQPE